MKSFISATLGAVVAGLLLFFAQNWWSQGQADAKQRITFDKISEISISRENLAQLARKGTELFTPAIQVFESQNTGNDDISEKSFSIASSAITGFASTSSPNGNPKNVNITYDGKVLTVKYRLLPKGSQAYVLGVIH